jgi:hypothetical protein
MLRLLAENLREHREIARLDSSYRHYQEISADVLLLKGGKSGISWVRLAIEQLATVLPHADTRSHSSIISASISKRRNKSRKPLVVTFRLQGKSWQSSSPL